MVFFLLIVNILYYIYMTYFCINGEPVGLTGRRVFMVTIINWKQFLVYLFIIALSFHLMFYLYYYLELLSLTLLGDELYSEEYYSMGKGNMNTKAFNKLFSESDIKKDVASYKPIHNSVVFESKFFNRQIISQTSLSAVSSNVGFKDFNSLDLTFNKVNSYDNQQNFYSSSKFIMPWEVPIPHDLSKTSFEEFNKNIYLMWIKEDGFNQRDFLTQFTDFNDNSKLCISLKERGLFHKSFIFDHKASGSIFLSRATSWPKIGPCSDLGSLCDNSLSPIKVLDNEWFDVLHKLNSDGQYLTQPWLVQDKLLVNFIHNKIANYSGTSILEKYPNFKIENLFNDVILNKYIYRGEEQFMYSKGKLLRCCLSDYNNYNKKK